MSVDLTLLARVAYRDREISGERLRALLALLAADLRTGSSTSRLVEGIWPGDRPAHPAKALQVLVSRARAQLGPDLIASTPTGYRLTLPEERVDAAAVLLRASAAARRSRAADHAGALAEAEAGLALWEGAPDDAAGDPVSELRAERRPARRTLRRVRALALARLGRHAEAVEALLALAEPRDEEVLAELLRGEAATAGPAAALERYEAYRRALRDELGTDPGPALQEIHRNLLAPAVRHGIPHEPNPLLGREADLAAVAALLRTSRVVSVTGPGGLGKTRLAQAVARRAEQRVVHLVPLVGVRADADVAAEVATALGAADPWALPRSHTTLLDEIARALGPGPALLVLDNCEHVLDGVADLVGALVAMTGDLRVLTTGRAPLGLSSETVHPLPELGLATAVELFGQRARAVRPGVDLPADDVQALCRRLDGLPLAVELAAARVRVMSVGEITARLEDRFALLRSGPRDAPQRHRTLHAVVDWSWNLLDDEGRAALRALSVLPGGFTEEAADAVLDGPSLDRLENLVDQSLLKVADTPTGVRFRMLETVREFSAARLEEAGETGRAVDGYLRWVRDLGTAHHETVFTDYAAGSFVDRLRAEQDNLVQALRHALDRSDASTTAAVVALLGGLWLVEANYSRLAGFTRGPVHLLARRRPAPEHVDMTRTALCLCALNSFMQGPRELRSLAALRRLPEPPPDTPARALTAVLREVPALLRLDPETVRRLCDSDSPLLAGIANGAVCFVMEHRCELERALEYAQRSFAALSRLGHPWALFLAHSRVGELALFAEDGELAERHMRAALHQVEKLNPRPLSDGLALALIGVALLRGEVAEAERRLATLERPSGETLGVRPAVLGVRAEIALGRGETDEGLRLWREAIAAWRGDPDPAYLHEPDGREPWTLETRSNAVVAHALHGRLDLVPDVVDGLLPDLTALLTDPMPHPPAYLVELRTCGAVLLALGLVDLTRGALPSGIQMIALAGRLGHARALHPGLATRVTRRAAIEADGRTYTTARARYADLPPEALRTAALELLALSASLGDDPQTPAVV